MGKKERESNLPLLLFSGLVITGMIFVNSHMIKVICAHGFLRWQSDAHFAEIADSLLYQILHFLLPINSWNIVLWENLIRTIHDDIVDDSFGFIVLTLGFIAGSIFIQYRLKKRNRVNIGWYVFACLISFVVLDFSYSPVLLGFNLAVYGMAIYLFSESVREREVSYFWGGLVLWLTPNLYQLLFLSALVI